MTGENGPNVVAAILTWRNEPVTRSCLTSVTRSTSWPFPVLVVDNASGTSEGVRLAAEFGPSVEALTMEANGGVPGGYNAGLRWASRKDADYVLLLNNDTIMSDPNMVDVLISGMSPSIAAVGPRVLRADGSTQSAGGQIRWRTGRAVQLTTPPVGVTSAPYEVDWLDGSCLLISLAAARVLGGFAEDYFLYWEDVDWGVRARRAGLRCEVQPTASIVHLGSATVTGPIQLRYWMRNKILFMRRNAGWRDNASAVASMTFRTLPYHLARERLAPVGWWRVLRSSGAAIGWNVADAIRRRSWRVPPTGPSIDDGSTPAD